MMLSLRNQPISITAPSIFRLDHSHIAYRIFALLLTAVLSATTQAEPVSAQATMQQLIHRVSNDLDGLYKKGRIGDRAAIEALIRSDIVPVLDRDRLTRRVLRQYWKDVEAAGRTSDAQHRVIESLVRTYAVALSSYAGDTITLVSVTTRDKNHIAKTRLRRPTGETIQVDFNLAQVGERWLINDMAVDGIVVSLTLFNAIQPLLNEKNIEGALSTLAHTDANKPASNSTAKP